MKNIIHTALTLMLCLVVCSFLSPTALAETIASGTSGDNLNWTMDNEGPLFISGYGDMTSSDGWSEHINEQGSTEAAQEAAEQAKDDVEAAAESVSQSAAQIETNKQDISDLKSAIGDKSSLNKDTKTNYVSAINEVNDHILTGIEEGVSDWLDAHLETAATVQDGSITLQKFKDEELPFVTPKMFGAKGDGFTDDTEAIQDCLSSMEDGSIFYLPKGEYIVTQVFTASLENAIYIFDGTLKLKDGLQTPYGVFVARGVNCVYDGLKINGNEEYALDEQEYGASCCLLVDTNISFCTFKNIHIYDTKYCASEFNIGVNNLSFENCIFDNIGEHCFYVAGDNAVNLRFQNIKASNIGMNSYNRQGHHESYVIKVKMATSKNISAINVILRQDSVPIVNVHVLGTSAQNNILENCKVLGYADSLAIPNNATNLTISNCVSEHGLIYSPIVSNKDESNIQVVNSKAKDVYYVDVVKIFVGCTFERVRPTMALFNSKVSPTYFIDCTFITNMQVSDGWGKFSYVNCDYHFINSNVVKPSGSLATYAFYFGSNVVSGGANIIFDGVVFEDSTTGYNIMILDEDLNIRITNCTINAGLVFAVNNLQLFNTNWKEATKLSYDIRTQYAKASVAYVFKDGDDVSELILS